MSKKRERGDGTKKPDRAGDAPPNTDRAPSNGPKVSERSEAGKIPAELDGAYSQLALLDGNLAGATGLLGWLDTMLRPKLDEPDPCLDGDGIGQVVEAVESLRTGLDVGRGHVRAMLAEIGLLQTRFLGAPSRTISLSSIMGRLARLTDTDLDIVSRLVMHCAARAGSLGR